MTVSIIKDGVVLHKEVKKFHTALGNLAVSGHALAVSAVWHAANSGRGDVVTAFYAGLTSALQGSFRSWLGHEEIGKGFMSYSKDKGFSVKKDTQEARDKFMAGAENITRSFFDKDTNANEGIGEFSKADLVTIFASMLRKATSDKSTLDKATRNFVLDCAKDAVNKLKGVEGQDKLAKLILDQSKPAANVNAKPSADRLTAVN